ncbi:MAG TPA: class I SAM-dependent methyltransferase, partial [Polyangiaceae bacterium]|nr:class I SAM-dependent methyltransferase [Polyangiaceae bacterium]
MPASRTAEYMAIYRALEDGVRERPPLFEDPFAASFLRPALRRTTKLARFRRLRSALERYADFRAPGARTSAIARTRFIDDVVREGVRGGCQQVVILGAGYDCRAHRLAELRGCTVFEVDRAETQDVKRARLERAPTYAEVNYVAIDFSRDDLEACLVRAGWRSTEPSVFVWEGVGLRTTSTSRASKECSPSSAGPARGPVSCSRTFTAGFWT